MRNKCITFIYTYFYTLFFDLVCFLATAADLVGTPKCVSCSSLLKVLLKVPSCSVLFLFVEDLARDMEVVEYGKIVSRTNRVLFDYQMGMKSSKDINLLTIYSCS